MNIGQPDIKTPKEFYEAIKNFSEDTLEYAHSRGLDILINSVIDYYKKFELDFNYEDIIITQGGSEAVSYTHLDVYKRQAQDSIIMQKIK